MTASCNFCGLPRTKLCDYRTAITSHGEPATCDNYLCDSCAVNLGPDFDFCPTCAKKAQMIIANDLFDQRNKKSYGKRCGNCANRLSGFCAVKNERTHPASKCVQWRGFLK